MNDPIKLIWKYKNNNRRIQYLMYIYVGTVPKDIDSILEKIVNLKFYDTLIKLNKQEYKKLENFYGDKWYLKFFNTLHINYSISVIKDSISQRNELNDKYGSEWFNKHIESFKLIEKKLIYSYEALIKDESSRKLSRKKRLTSMEEEINENYKTVKSKLLNQERKQIGGDDEEYEEEPIEESSEETAGETTEEVNGETSGETGELEDLESGEVPQEEEEDLKEIEELIVEPDVRIDENIEKTTNQIKKALDNDKTYKKSQQILDFDNSKDNNIYDENLKNIYFKTYVKNQYIYKDDTIKTIKDKICCSIKNNDKFSKNSYIIPSRQYFWSEYYFDNKIERIMLGQKWMKSIELLNVDIEPNNNL